jgi:hypothetical protein
MKPSELKYITQDIIDKGGINVSSPEMLDEARRYNMDVVKNAASRHRLNTIVGIVIILQIPVLLASVCLKLTTMTLADFSNFSFKTGTVLGPITTYARIGALVIGLLAYLGLFIYYIIWKGQRDSKMMFLCSFPLMATTILGVGIAIINVILGMVYEKTDEKLSEEAGYPAFVRLNVTTIESDAESIHDLTYDSIKERAKRLRPDDNDQFLS